jgi:putative RNA 2'-phosphotransferase
MLDKRTSRFLSLVLRHKPEKIGLELDENGWANVGDILRGLDITFWVLVDIVENNDKQRFAFNHNKTMIRANQGHSIDVDVGLKEVAPPYILYHGTADKFINKIKKTGLLKMNRNHVHLSDNLDTAIKVGLRHGGKACTVISVLASDMVRGGHKFYLSENGVWLTDRVPTSYISKMSGAQR